MMLLVPFLWPFLLILQHLSLCKAPPCPGGGCAHWNCLFAQDSLSSITFASFFYRFLKFIYYLIILTTPGLCYHVGFSLVAVSGGCSRAAVHGLLIAAESLLAELRL